MNIYQVMSEGETLYYLDMQNVNLMVEKYCRDHSRRMVVVQSNIALWPFTFRCLDEQGSTLEFIDGVKPKMVDHSFTVRILKTED